MATEDDGQVPPSPIPAGAADPAPDATRPDPPAADTTAADDVLTDAPTVPGAPVPHSGDWGTSLQTQPHVDVDGAGGADDTFRVRGFDERYRRGALLGVGGMGEVRAWADRATGREVAMKTIRGTRDEPLAARRFAREARIQAQLEHPSIVPVYDLGVDDDGAMYFTMKQVRGHSLARVLATLWDRGDPGYSQRKLLGVLVRVAMALELAHRRGVVNRDLKPSNIMLGAFDEVYVIDWGLALVREPGAPPTASRPDLVLGLPVPAAGLHGPLVDSSQRPETASGQLVGTPGYVAPEQIHSAEDVDHRADIYALGVILFEILAGERLHRGDTLAEILMSTLQVDGASPAARAPDAGISPELDALCQWATRLDPDRRPQRASDLARALDDYLDGDRDVERRRLAAARSAEAAATALSRSARPGADEHALRADALRAVGSALALDPDNLMARRTLVRALTEPARSPPPAAEEAYRAGAVRSVRFAGRNATLALLTYVLYVPFLLWMGVREPWMLAAMAGAIGAVVVLTWHYTRRPPAELALPWPHLVATTIALLTGVALFGPLLLLPAIVIVNGVGYIATFGRRSILYVIPGLAVVVVPIVLQAAGLVPRSYVFDGDTIQVVPAMTYLPPTPTLVFLIVTHVVVISVSLGYVWRLRCNYLDVERRMHMQAWQLAQLVPASARSVLDESDPDA